MRVIAGELGGRRLRAPRGDGVRPTSDRVREALFSILGEIKGASVLDLFAGTGALAIEALSRGAAHATLVDTEITAATRNVEELGLAARTQLVRGDALAFLAREGPAYDLVFCDPPYRLARRIATDLDRLLVPRLRDGARVIVETATDDRVELSLTLLDERSYGATGVRIHGGSS